MNIVGRKLPVILLSMMLSLAACPGDDGTGGSGTGGDDQMPDDMTPGPGGPSCVVSLKLLPLSSSSDRAGMSQPGRITSVIELTGDPFSVEMPPEPRTSTSASATSLAPVLDPLGATTADPHIHERWGSARRLELSYCINGMPGDDAELEFAYHKTMRSLITTTAEWERVSGVNFVHAVEYDTPDESPHLSVNGPDIIARADCGDGTNPYFGVFALQLQQVQGVTNVLPQRWDDPDLAPMSGALTRTIAVDVDPVLAFGDTTLLTVLRHEFGHVMGFLHEEVNLPGQVGGSCTDPDPRPLTPADEVSVLATPGCPGLDDAGYLSHRDRLSAFFLQHTPRSRFETRLPATGYRYTGQAGSGAEILWHSDGSTAGTLWRSQVVADEITFIAEPFAYSPPQGLPLEDWFPHQSEVVIPLQLGGDAEAIDLLFFGPGPDVSDYAVINTAGSTAAVAWSAATFSVPVVGRFDGDDLDRDVVYLYDPGTTDSMALVASGASVSVLVDVPQQLDFAYPIAAPYRGASHPDDILWLDPQAGTIETWRLGGGILTVLDGATVPQGELGLAPGENIPAVGDFNGDGRADVMWHGVSNLPAGLPDITDVLWLSESNAETLAFATVPKEVGRSYRPFVGDFDGDGIHDIFWHRSWGMTSDGPSATTTGPSFIWYFDAAGGHQAKTFQLDFDASPYVGDFDADGCHDVAWFDAVGDTLLVWRCLPQMRDFDCGSTFPTPPDAAPVGIHWGF